MAIGESWGGQNESVSQVWFTVSSVLYVFPSTFSVDVAAMSDRMGQERIGRGSGCVPGKAKVLLGSDGGRSAKDGKREEGREGRRERERESRRVRHANTVFACIDIL